MRRIQASAVFVMGGVATFVLVCFLAFPVAKREWSALLDRRAHARDFVPAAASDQQEIVRSFLVVEMRERILCLPDGVCPPQTVYFDRSSALFRSVGAPGPGEPYELQTIRPEGGLVNRENTSAPVDLQILLDRLVQLQSFNDDPKLDGLIYVRDVGELPKFGPGQCGNASGARLLRVSRAAIQQSAGMALVLVSTTYCDGGTGLRVARLKRENAKWRLEEIWWA